MEAQSQREKENWKKKKLNLKIERKNLKKINWNKMNFKILLIALGINLKKINKHKKRNKKG